MDARTKLNYSNEARLSTPLNFVAQTAVTSAGRVPEKERKVYGRRSGGGMVLTRWESAFGHQITSAGSITGLRPDIKSAWLLSFRRAESARGCI